MAFDYRCPACKAKLRLEDEQPAGTPIECPKCDVTFNAPALSETTVKKLTEGDPPKDDKPAEPKKKKIAKNKMEQERTFMNEFLLLGIVGGAMFGLILTCTLILWLMGRSARVEDMVSLLPSNYNAVRGVSVDQMRKYPGFKPEVDRIYDTSMAEGYAELAKAIGQAPESLTYLIVAKDGSTPGSTSYAYIFRVKKSFDTKAFAKMDGATASGEGYTVSNANTAAFLKGSTVYCPSDQLVVVFKGSDPSGNMSKMAAVAKSEPKDSTREKLGTTGRLAMRAHFWTIVRPEGAMKDYLKTTGATVKTDMPKLTSTLESATLLATWCTVSGRGFRFGAGIECSSDDAANELKKNIREGKLGKGDESEPPNELKTALSIVGQKKEFGEFMQYVDFKTKSKSAFCTSKLESPEGSKSYFGFFSNVYWGSQGSGGGGPGFGPPGGGPPGGGPPGGPPGGGPPGGGPPGGGPPR